MNAGIVFSFHGSFEDKLEKWAEDKDRISEFAIIKKYSDQFDKVFIFTTDSKKMENVLPDNCKHVRLFSRFLYLPFCWLVVLFYSIFRDMKIIYAECGPSLPSVFMVNKLTGAKVVLNYDNTWFLSAYGMKRKIVRVVEKFLLNFVDYFIIASTEIMDFVGNRGVIVPVKKGIIVEAFDPGKVRSDPLMEKIKGKIIIFVGRLHEVKDPVTLMKAYSIAKKKVPNLHLVIAGDGELKGECEKLADKDVHFLGYTKDVPGLLKGSDVFVMTSVYDASPRSLMEAMAMGLPSVATNVGGIPDYLDGDTGFIVEPGNPGKLAEKIVYLLKNPSKAGKMGKMAREKMLKHHDLNRNLDRSIKFLKGAIRK